MGIHIKIGAWIREFVQLFRGPLHMAIYKKPPEHYLRNKTEGKAHVILIPGVGNTWSYFRDLGNEISLLGHPVHTLPELGTNITTIPRAAEILYKAVQNVESHEPVEIHGNIKGTRTKGVVLVAHSKGGLIGKYLLAHFNQDGRVLGMIAIATPFSGSKIAKLIPHNAYKELRLDSKIIANLKAHTASNKKIISIYSEYDTHVSAPEGSYLQGAFENIQIPIGGHSILDNKELQKETISAIEKISCWERNPE